MRRFLASLGLMLACALPACAIPHGNIITQKVQIDCSTVNTVVFPTLPFNSAVQPFAVQVVAVTAVSVASPPQISVNRGAPGFLDILPPTDIINAAVPTALTTFTDARLSTGARVATTTTQPFTVNVLTPITSGTLVLEVTLFLYVP